MAGKIKDLNEILPPELLEMDAHSASEFFGQPLVFHGARELTGSNGRYKRISVSLPESDEQFIISCGAGQVMAVLDWALSNRAFPFTGQFVQADKAILLKGTS